MPKSHVPRIPTPISPVPKKALILYTPCEPNQPIPNVNNVIMKGCAGQLALEETEAKVAVSLQLLGLYDRKGNYQIKSQFKQRHCNTHKKIPGQLVTLTPHRFHGMSLAILSNHKPTLNIANQLDCFKDYLISIPQIQQLLLNTRIDVLLVDYTGYKNSWRFINELLATENNDYITCVISPFIITPETDKIRTFAPRQSYTVKDGSEVILNSQTALMYAYYHSGSGRKDNTTEYTVKDIAKNGGNNKILAAHFLAEVGHKLGFVPKYGA